MERIDRVERLTNLLALLLETQEPLYAPPPMLSRMVEAGLLGRKAGRGFYDYARK